MEDVYSKECASDFKLADIFLQGSIEQLGGVTENIRIHTTGFKVHFAICVTRIASTFQGRETFLIFEKEIGAAVLKSKGI